jgi:hypothetical protein
MPLSSATPVARPFFDSTLATRAFVLMVAPWDLARRDRPRDGARAASGREAAAHGHRVFGDPLKERRASPGRSRTSERSEQRARRDGRPNHVGLEPLVDEVTDRHRHPSREARPVAPTQRARAAPGADEPPPIAQRRVVEGRRRLAIESAQDGGDAVRGLQKLAPGARVVRRNPVD